MVAIETTYRRLRDNLATVLDQVANDQFDGNGASASIARECQAPASRASTS
jgi:hypothetical protein